MRFLWMILLLVMTAGAEANPVTNAHSTAELIADVRVMQPGQPFWAMVRLEMQKDWHTYWINPGDSGMATSLSWELPEGFSASEIHWPVPERISIAGLVSYGYSDQAMHLVRITPPAALETGREYALKVKAQWLICHEICVPEQAELVLPMRAEAMLEPSNPVLLRRFNEAMQRLPAEGGELRMGEAGGNLIVELPESVQGEVYFLPVAEGLIANAAVPQVTSRDGRRFLSVTREAQALPEEVKGLLVTGAQGVSVTARLDPALSVAPPPEQALWHVLLLALLGGIILNAMPCVFPILSLKALALAKKSAHELPAIRRQGLAYTAGVLVSFVLLAGVLILLQQSGRQVGWGYQMQEPMFVAAMAYLLFAVGLSLSGFFLLPSWGAGLGQASAARGGMSGSFVTGVLATVVAAPCTAPFMAPAVAVALAQPPLVAMTVFLALGFGLALPYLLVSWFPALHRHLPRPGAWMERFKQFLAFPMYASAAWMLWVLAQQSGSMGLGMALAGLLVLSFALWLAGQIRGRWLWVVWMVAALLLVMTLREQQPVQNATAQERFSNAALAALRAKGTPVLVDATAAWCLTCKVNERVALRNEAVKAALAEKKVTLLVADWTNQDPEITAYLRSHGRSGVPMVVYYPPGGEPKLLPEILTPGIVLDALAVQ